ncbi:hypothetical protein D9C73_022220 [Collichthys lucidus]|uniref:Uncharacterized protein n=1 Tax=Collichthys lucidus TaxID=240159 RepID=A0A4U5VIT9_COLLU|nr:hypothetical protein D9C73_022220 [Collichthys lucidus]
MDSSGCSRDSAPESNRSARREEPSSGGRPELLLFVTCVPEGYRAAKLSLAAYLLCWALLRWYQKLRCQSAPLQGTQNDGRPASQFRARKLLEVKGEGKASVVPGGLRTCCWVDVERDGGGQQRRRKCSDDLWIEEQKKYKRKLARAIRGSVGQLSTLLCEGMDKARRGHSVADPRVTLGPIEAFRGMPLKAHCFSQSTPIGLDCLGWRRRISYTYTSDLTDL